MSIFSLFRRNNRGNVATMFALSLIPLIGAVGAAVDYSRIALVRTELGDALDAGVLALGTQPSMTDAKAIATVTAWMDAHMNGVPYTLDTLTQLNGKITGNASAVIDMTLARILGVNQVTVKVTSQILKTLGKIELALVLDNTGSMKGTKIATLRTAAASLVDSLSTSAVSPDNFRVALVPFSMTVNVGSTYKNAAWIDTTAASPIANEIFTKPANRFTLFQQMSVDWKGCVESRPFPYDVQNDLPSSGTPATLYVPFFAPDEPDSGGTFYNNYLPDAKGDITFANRQGNPVKYTVKPKTGTNGVGYQYGPNAGCELAPLLRLSSNTSQVKTAIQAMQAVGDTNIPLGLAWGWNVLAPSKPGAVFGDGVDYTDDEWSKIVVLMTDGQNQNTKTNNPNDSFYSGIGYIWQNRIGLVAGSSEAKRTAALDARLATLCQNMKDKGIIIYTVRVEVKSGSSAVLQNCASDLKKFYDVQDVGNLVAVFNEIGASIKKLRIAL